MVGGGDGTISFAAAAAARCGKTLGILPLGTMNLFARSLGMPLEMRAAAEAIAAGEKVAVDIGEVNGRLLRAPRHARPACADDPAARADGLLVAARKDLREHQGLVDGGPRIRHASTLRFAPIRSNSAANGGNPGDQQSARRRAHPLCRRSPPRHARPLRGKFTTLAGSRRHGGRAWRSAASRQPLLDNWVAREVDIRLPRPAVSASVDGEIVSLRDAAALPPASTGLERA